MNSLCILQDSDDDKVQEINKMSVIYDNAHVIISASIAASCADKFLHEQSKIESEQFSLLFCCLNDHMSEISLYELELLLKLDQFYKPTTSSIKEHIAWRT